MGISHSTEPKVLVALLVLTQLLFHGMSGAVIDLSGDPRFGGAAPPVFSVGPGRGAPGRAPPVPPVFTDLSVPGFVHNNGGRYRLYSKCSKSHVQVKPRSVNARTARNQRYMDLIFHIEDVAGVQRLRIQGAHSKLFICFNKKGKLIARPRHSKQFEDQAERCQFTEHQTPHGYTELQSVANPLWYVGFRKNGKPMRGYRAQQHDRRRCFGLVKTAVTSPSRTRHQSSRFSLPNQHLPHRRRHRRHRWPNT